MMLAIACVGRTRFLCVGFLLALTTRAPGYFDDSPASNANPSAASRPDQERIVRLFKITPPVNNVDRIRHAVDRFVAAARTKTQWPVLIFEIESGRIEFGQALDLARYLTSPELDGATSVAYLPQGATGHAVLIAIACDEIALPASAEFGNAGRYERHIGADMRSVYNAIAQRRRTVPPDVVLGMLDPELEVLQVETEVSREYILRERLPDLVKKHAVTTTRVIIPAGQSGKFTGREAKELGFVSYVTDDRAALAKAFGVSAQSLEDDLSLVGEWKPVLIRIHGPITTGLVQQTQRMVDKSIRYDGCNFILLDLESPGGSPDDSLRLAGYLANLNSATCRTVAYIPQLALADAAFVALACDQLIMQPNAKLGGQWSREVPPTEAAMFARSLGEIARLKQHSAALAAALIDPSAEVFRYHHRTDGSNDYFTPQQAARLKNPNEWDRQERVSADKQRLEVDGKQAVEMGLARATVIDFHELKALYELQDDPRLVEPTWVDQIVSVLNSQAAGWVLLVLAAIGLYIEAHSPGLGVGGFAAGICFLLFFWSHYLGGTADWLEILLFAAGVLSILMEIFVLPGVGIFAFGGGALILISILLASQTFVLPRDNYEAAQMLRSLAVFSGIFVGFIAAAMFVRRFLPQTPGLAQMVLAPPTREELEQTSRREALALYDHLVGAHGIAVTPLTPAGKARFGGELVDVLTEGEFLAAGSPVQVNEVRAHRVLVRPAPSADSVG